MSRSSVLAAVAGLVLTASPVFATIINTITDNTPTGATANGTVAGGEYVGTVSGGGNGFGGPVGGATLSVDSDLNGIYLGFSNLGDISGNSIRVYFDSKTGGNTTLSDAAFNDFQDFGRERISRPARDGLTLPFAADYGLIISDAFGGFQSNFELIPGGNGSLVGANTGNVYTDPNSDDAGATDGTIEAFISYANLGMVAGGTVDFVVVYANNNDQDNAFMSNEGFPAIAGGNPGFGPVTLSDNHRLVTYVPEPASIGLIGLGMIGLMGRRRVR